MSKMAKEFAEKYLKEELNSRLKYLGGQPDALCQAYQAALEAMAPKRSAMFLPLKQEMRRLIWSRLAFHRQMKTNGKMRMLKNWTKKTSGLM